MGGIVVVGIGVILLLGQVVPDAGRWIPLIVGLIFLAGFITRREYGLLVAGSIITGVGVGVVLTEYVDSSIEGAMVVLSLAGGFLAIWVVAALLRLPQNHWWPFVPGGILATVGLFELADVEASGIERWWPLFLVALGALIIGRAVLRSRS